MSELDNLSDSEWLDISSGRDSDDNESLSDQDSDHDEISSMPRSRRSSISNGDSIVSDVEAWEGFISEGGEENDSGMYPVPLSSPLGAEPIAVGFDPCIAPEATAEEDKKVREALDQSFVGTLSASRSSTLGSGHLPTAHTSIRDLRLSFPDPLTSSRDELNRSYEAVSSPVETTSSYSTDGDVSKDSPASVSSTPPPIEDPGYLFTTPEVQRHEVQDTELGEKSADLDIVLYGTSSEIKWRFVQELILKAGMSSGQVLNDLRENKNVRNLRFIKTSDSILFSAIDIFDKTNEGLVKTDVHTFTNSERPSLAIVYLPAAKLPVLAWHDAYLPVLVPSITDVDKNVMLQAAEDDWDLLGVPTHKVIKLGATRSSVFDANDLISLDSTHVYEAMRDIGREEEQRTPPKPLTEQVKSVNAVTLFALMSLIMGFAINTAFRPPTPSPTPTVNTPSSGNGQLWGILAPQPNRSVLTPSVARGNSKTCESGQTHTGASTSFKDMALSVFIPGSTSLSVTPLPASKGLTVASTSKSVAVSSSSSRCAQCESSSSKPTLPKQSTDIVLRSPDATSLAEIPIITPTVSSIASRTDTGSTILLGGTIGAIPMSTIATAASAAANLNLNHVSEVLGATGKAFADAVANDYSEIVEAADGLLNSLREQRDNVIRQSKGKARAFGEQLQNINDAFEYRNNRAKKRAKELTAKGGAVVKTAGKLFKDGTLKAQGRAKGIKQTLIEGGTEVWKTYEKAHGEWEGVLSRHKQGRRRNTDYVRRRDRIRYDARAVYDHL